MYQKQWNCIMDMANINFLTVVAATLSAFVAGGL